jgi:hypothetical protein
MKQDRNMNIMFDLAIDLREGGMLRKKETRYNKKRMLLTFTDSTCVVKFREDIMKSIH